MKKISRKTLWIPVWLGIPLLVLSVSARDRKDQELQCDRLYEHTLTLSAGDPAFLLADNIRNLQHHFQEESERRIFRENCMIRMDSPSLACQLNAKSLKDLLDCRLPPSVKGSSGSDSSGGSPAPASKGSMDRPSLSSGSGEKTGESSDKTEIQSQGSITVMQVDSGADTEVTEKKCREVYDHMITVYEKAPLREGGSKKDFEEMVRNWKTPESRKSFVNRCLKDFKPGDLSCIRASSDPDVIQACLIQIP